MSAFFALNQDYALLLAGLVLAVGGLAVRAHGARLADTAWRWLALFAFGRALHAWLELLRVAGPSATSFLDVIQPALLTVAGLCLVEFARQHAVVGRGFRLDRWLYLPVLVVGLLAIWLGDREPARTCEIVTAAGALGAAVAFQTNGAPAPGRFARLFASAAFSAAVFAVFAPSFFAPAVEIDGSAAVVLIKDAPLCLALAGLSLALARAGGASTEIAPADDPVASARRRRTLVCGVAVVVLLAVGWLATEIAGKRKDAAMRSDVLARSKLAAAAVNVALLREIRWDDSDLANPAYEQTKRLMISLARANADLRFVLLAGLRDGRCYFIADSESPDSKDYSPPGQLYAEADPAYVRGMAQGKSFVLGPVTDRWGVWIIGSVPVLDLGPERGSINLELDIAAGDWAARIHRQRLPVVLITLLIAALTIISFSAQERIRDQLAQLILSEQRATSIVESSPNCVLILDAAGRCLVVNRNGLDSLGLVAGGLAGRAFTSFWPTAVRGLVDDAVKATAAGKPARFEADYVHPDGRTLTWQVATSPVRDAAGRVRNLVCICVDMTERKNGERALLAAKEAAETATRIKSEFLAVMSHEIRTPLGGVIGLLDLLRAQPQPPAQRRHTELALDSAETLLHILDDVLDTAKIESGKLTIESVPFAPVAEFTRVLEGMRARAEAKQLDLSWTFSPNLPDAFVGDPTRLRQVLANLLNNAIKFTAKGGIAVAVDVADLIDAAPAPAGKAGRAMLRLGVRDTGIGMTSEVRTRLFGKFEQADASTTRRFGGTGLGLSIVKGLVERMEGTIAVESEPGVGSVFTVSLPLAIGSKRDLPANDEFAPTSLPPQTASLHLLCAEDDAINREIAKNLAAQLGHTLEFALNGEEALDRLRATRFDAVLMDNRMPVMDGFQATRLIREGKSGARDPAIPIIAATANASLTYREQCLAAGMNDYLTKPLRAPALHAALERAIAALRARGVSVAPMTSPAVRDLPGDDTAVGLSEAELLAAADSQALTPDAPIDGISPEALEKIFALYREETPVRLAEMKTARARGDFGAVARAAHSLKSNSRYVGAVSLAERCAEIERLADAGDGARLATLIVSAEEAFAELKIAAHSPGGERA